MMVSVSVVGTGTLVTTVVGTYSVTGMPFSVMVMRMELVVMDSETCAGMSATIPDLARELQPYRDACRHLRLRGDLSFLGGGVRVGNRVDVRHGRRNGSNNLDIAAGDVLGMGSENIACGHNLHSLRITSQLSSSSSSHIIPLTEISV